MAITKVQTIYGCIAGVPVSSTVTAFKGIPFAKPPIGALRWKRPQPPEAWSGVFAADRFRAKPPQGNEIPARKEYPDEELTAENEDCLYLNVWTPAVHEAERLPVMLWIPGGGFMTGDASSRLFWGEAYGEQGVILITAMHRTGALGYMSHPHLTEVDGSSGNYALYDLVAMLDWIQDNIRAFGGDPDNVTIAGQSSGCVAVQALLQCPLAKGKYKRAIMQSGRALDSGDVMDTAESALWKGQLLMEKMGANTLEEMYALDPQDLFFALKDSRMPRYDATGRPLSEQENPGRMLYHTDNEGMLELFDEAALAGLNCDVDILIGSTKDESGGASSQIRANSCIVWAENQIKLGYRPCYVYRFDRDRPDDPNGASHSAELAYQFGTLSGSYRPYTDGDYALSALMVKYWTNFAKTGDPNGPGLPLWRAYSNDHKVRMHLDIISKELQVDM